MRSRGLYELATYRVSVPIRFDPPDLIEGAAQEESWTDSDRQHVIRIVRQAFEESFQVKQIQRTSIGLIAYDAPFTNLESVLFVEGAEKPVLRALEDLSRQLLNVKHERDTRD
jgi:hypothetical protein